MNCLYRFEQALLGVLRQFPGATRRLGRCGRSSSPSARGRPASDATRQSDRAPGASARRLPRSSDAGHLHPPTIRPIAWGCSRRRLKKVIATEEADKKLERAIRKGEVKRYHDNDWIAEAKSEGRGDRGGSLASLAELRDLVARVIAVDDFDAAYALLARKAPAPHAAHQPLRPEPHEHPLPPSKGEHGDDRFPICRTGASRSISRASPGPSSTARARA